MIHLDMCKTVHCGWYWLDMNNNLLGEHFGCMLIFLNYFFKRAALDFWFSRCKVRSLCSNPSHVKYFHQITFWIGLWELVDAANPVNWFLKPRFFKKRFLICKSLSLGPHSSETTWLHAREQPMELWLGLFHNTSCWEMADPLFSRPTSLWARVPAVSTLRKHTSLPGYIFLSFLNTLEATVTIPALSPPLQALLFSPLQSPHHRAREKTKLLLHS